jgi:hypothetical protein
MKGMQCLTALGLEALNRGEIICLGSFSTRGLNGKEMLRELNKKKRVGSWCPNIFDNANFPPTKSRDFRLVAVRKPVEIEMQWKRIVAEDLASSFGFDNNMTTIEMSYYLWESRLALRRLNDHGVNLSCLVVCHPGVCCGRDVCKRIAVIDDKFVVSGGISGPGHSFGDKAGFVYALPC